MSEAPTEAFGPYLVYEQLGAGGMARVDRAEVAGVEGFHRPVALKRMLPHCASHPDMVKAFVREARLASHLRHANVAQTYELGKVGSTYFIAMELITGPTLRAVLKHCAVTTGPMPVPVALNILNQICDALDYAHNLCDETGQPLGIIHRDVSPSNIILAEGGVAKLIDFGIAKASAAGMQTMSGTLKGKFGYMAPEYILGRIDARVDLFAIGVIAHELLTNRPLFSAGDDMETLERVRHMQIAPPSRRNPSVPREVDEIVMTALERDPDQRWQHATALRTALTTVTQRLGLGCHNQQVVEWIGWAFEQTKPRVPALAPLPAADSEPSIAIEQPTRAEARVGSVSASVPAPVPAAPVGAATLLAEGGAAPARGPGPEPVAVAALGEEYRAAVAAYAQREAAVPGSGPAPEHAMTTKLRAAPGGVGAAGTAPPVAGGTPAGAPVAEAGPRATGVSPAQGAVRARGSHEPANRPLVTLLDGAAAVRARTESQRLPAAQRPSAPMAAPASGYSAPAPGSPTPASGYSAPTLAGGYGRPASGTQPVAGPGGGGVPSLGERGPSPPRSGAGAARGARGPVWVVILVLLAAAAAATGTYLVLPYLT